MVLETYVQRGSYKQYHSSLKLFVSAGGSSAVAFDLGIPKSTVSSWKNTDFSKLIVHPVAGSAEKDLKLFQKFIKDRFAQRIFSVYTGISDSFHSILNNYKESITSFKDSILPVINTAKYTLGIANTLKIFRVSRQRYDSWIKNKSCSASPIGLCVKKYPNQLNSLEMAGLKELFSSCNYHNWPLVSVYFQGLRDNLITISQTTFYSAMPFKGNIIYFHIRTNLFINM